MALTPFEQWENVYNDSQLEIKRNPQDPTEYGLIPVYLKNEKGFNILLMPRGTFPEIAINDREHGKRVLENLANDLLPDNWFSVIQKSRQQINVDSLLAAIKTAYISEEEKRQDFIKSRG